MIDILFICSFCYCCYVACRQKRVCWMALFRAEVTGEYCQFEHFNASCRSPTERIYIRSAQYGRMRVGRCVKVDLGYLGCVADVRHVIESRCSGRPHCSVAVIDDELRKRSPCPTDVTSHLQVSYACVTGQSVSRPICHAQFRYKIVCNLKMESFRKIEFSENVLKITCVAIEKAMRF